jgi:hypothetical protein
VLRRGSWLIRARELYLTDFLESTFAGGNAKNSHFCGGINYELRAFTIPPFTIALRREN